MQTLKPVSTPLAAHFKLLVSLSLSTYAKCDYMSRDPYASAVVSIIYAIFCTRMDLLQEASIINRYTTNPSKEH